MPSQGLWHTQQVAQTLTALQNVQYNLENSPRVS